MVNPLKVSSLSSRSGKAELKAAGIDTNSKQYKAAVKEMSKHKDVTNWNGSENKVIWVVE